MVGLLLVLLVLVGLALWVTSGDDDSTDGTVDSTAPAVVTTPGAGGPVTSASAEPSAPAAIVSAKIFDPDGDSTENDDLVGRVIDGSTDSAWSTVCYLDKYLGGKRGVGVVLTLNRASTGSFDIAVASAPYQVRVYAVGSKKAPTEFTDWGPAVESFAGAEAGTVRVTLPAAARHVLVSFQELGRGATCSSQNPYRGVLGEVTFTPA